MSLVHGRLRELRSQFATSQMTSHDVHKTCKRLLLTYHPDKAPLPDMFLVHQEITQVIHSFVEEF